MSSNATQFLETFFKKLKAADFKTDRVLGVFYASYLKQLELDKKDNIEPPMLFQFFTEYIIRNKTIPEGEYNVEIKKIYANIMDQMLNPTEVDDDDNPRLRHIEKKEETINKTTPHITETKIKYKLNKLHAMNVISEFIKMSFIVTDDTPDIESHQEDVDFRDNSTVNIAEEIIAEFGSLPIAVKDVDFERRNEIIEIWHSCENNCMKFILKDALADVLKKVHIINCNTLNINTSVIHTHIDDALEDENLPSEELKSLYTRTSYKTIVSIVKNNVLSESTNKSRQKIKNLLVVAEHQFNTGGNTEQGYESNITPLYLSSSYNLSLNRASYIYPLEPNIAIYSPSVLVFKDHTKKKYPMLGPTNGCSVSVLTSAPVFRPALNVSIDKYAFDPKLLLPNTRYIDESTVEKQLTGIFNIALFFNYHTVIIDDRGPLYSFSPIHHTAQIMNRVINKYKGLFAEIIVCVPNDKLYNIYLQYIK